MRASRRGGALDDEDDDDDDDDDEYEDDEEEELSTAGVMATSADAWLAAALPVALLVSLDTDSGSEAG